MVWHYTGVMRWATKMRRDVGARPQVSYECQTASIHSAAILGRGNSQHGSIPCGQLLLYVQNPGLLHVRITPATRFPNTA